jgi:membrane-associated protease RseP (regulator of RpoE activity)
MEMARHFAGDANYEGRTLVFMTFAGEELGLLGSQYFCKNPTVPLEQIVAMVNLDMVGRLRPDKGKTKGKLEVIGVGSAKELKPMVEEASQKYDFDLTKTESPFGMLAGASDHASFAEKKIPVLFMFTGLHTEYHKPSDTVNLINFDGMKKVVDFTTELIGRLARIDRPAYVQTKRPAMGRVAGGVPRIGFMPGNYNEEDKGVLVGGVTDGGPAAKAGMKDNDIIVQIAGKPVKNMTAYMELMRLQKKDAPVEIVVERAGKPVKLMVTPE